MRSTFRPGPADQPSLARRSASVALTVAAHALIALLLLRLAPSFQPQPPPSDPLDTFDISAAPATPQTSRTRAATRARTTASPPPAAAATPPPPVLPPPTLPVPRPTPPVDLSLFGDRALADAADLSRVRGSGGKADGDEGADSVAPYGPGEGPGGQRLFNAEWQREPSDSELNGYLPNGAPPGGWALIACRTIADYQVDNCRVLGESPLNSGLGKAMRQAAWQFRIRPPRVGGKPMIGAWVRIHIDFRGRRAVP